jgi:hypothetical protein
MKYAVEMSSDAMLYIPSIINTGSGIQKEMGSIRRQHGDLISLRLFYFFQNNERSLKSAFV